MYPVTLSPGNLGISSTNRKVTPSFSTATTAGAFFFCGDWAWEAVAVMPANNRQQLIREDNFIGVAYPKGMRFKIKISRGTAVYFRLSCDKGADTHSLADS